MTDSSPAPQRRVRVTSPRTGAPRTRRATGTSEIDAQSDVGEIYMSSLLRAQLRLAALVLVAVGVLLALGWLYVRAAERNERDFTDVVERR
jgi:hypothetical protein